MNSVSAPILVLPQKLGGWHKHIHYYDDQIYTCSCWRRECWEEKTVIKQYEEDLHLD